MAKRLLDLLEEENNLKKKVKLESDLIWDKLKGINEELDIDQLEVEKFLLIFHLSMQPVNSEKNLDDADGIPDLILKTALKSSELLKNNIDSLKLPEIFKAALKKIKNLFLKGDGQNETKAESGLQPEETCSSTADSQTEENSEATRSRR